MANETFKYDDSVLTDIKLAFDVDNVLLDQVTPMEITLSESLLNCPGLQTSVKVHSFYQGTPVKNLDKFKGVGVNINLNREILKQFNITSDLEVQQVVYRIERRKPINNNTEEFTFHICDQTLLNDAATLVSKSWKCTTPSDVVSYVLQSCAGAKRVKIEPSQPARDYIAENIHPFQVVAQQANYALAAGNDPSFVHFMTYNNLGTHHFESLYSMTKKSSICTYEFSEVGMSAGYANPRAIMTLNFPCDFDLLSDILNGIGPDGNDISSLAAFNPVMKIFSLFGNQTIGCGIGSGVLKVAMSNLQSAGQQNMCPDYSQFYILKRQARMGLLEPDKIALRIVVPWNPELHAGEVITLDLKNKEDPSQQNYGHGDYLIVNMFHTIKYGGFSTTTMDCVAKTVGQGGIV